MSFSCEQDVTVKKNYVLSLLCILCICASFLCAKYRICKHQSISHYLKAELFINRSSYTFSSYTLFYKKWLDIKIKTKIDVQDSCQELNVLIQEIKT